MIFDSAVAAIILISCVIAFFRGFIRETLTILGVAGGAFASVYGGPLLAPAVRGWLGVHEGAEEPEKLFGVLPMGIAGNIIAYGGIFVVVVIVLSVISHMLSGWARAVGLGALDRSFGVLFGIARAAVLITFAYIPVLVMVDDETRDGWFEDSKTRTYIEAAAAWSKNLLPESMSEEMRKKADEGIGQAAREKLQELDVLRRDGDEASPGPEEDGGAGYRDEQRRDMNEMLNDGYND